MKLLAPISVGDLADRISILELKLVNIENVEKRKNISAELIGLKAVWTTLVLPTQQAYSLPWMLKKLDTVNARIWKLEDAARIPKYVTDDATFLTTKDRAAMAMLLKSIARSNDERSVLKRTISKLMESDIIEEKSHKG